MTTSPVARVVLLVASGLCVSGLNRLMADEITDELAAAQEAYTSGNISEAIQALDMARQLMMQKTAGDLATMFPEVDGLTRGEPQSSATGQAMFGGMVTAECEYTATSGDGHVTVRYITKSPMLQTIGMMFSMPGMAGDMKVERIAGKRALVKRDGSSGEIKIIYESELLVEIDYGDLDYEKAKVVVGAIPWDKLGKLITGG